MNYITFHKARVNAKTGLISVAVQLHEDQDFEDEELRELDEERQKVEEDEEANGDFVDRSN